MRIPIDLNQTVPNFVPQGPPTPLRGGMGSLARRGRRMGRASGMGAIVQVGSTIASGPFQGYPTGTVYLSSDELGNPIPMDASGNVLEYVLSDGTPGPTPGSSSPGIFDQVGNVITGGLNAVNQAEKAVSIGIWVGLGLLAYVVYKEAETPEGRHRLGNQAKNTATGAAHAAGSIAKAALL